MRDLEKSFVLLKAHLLILMKRIKDTIAEGLIFPAQRLAVCLYFLVPGDYIYTIAELTGLGSSSVSNTVTEICEAIVEVLWKDHVDKHFPKITDDYK